MNIFLMAVQAPSDLWTKMINWVNASVGNFGWAILLATIIVKLAMTPLDFLVKLSTKKQTLIQQKLSPQLAKLQKKYGNDQQNLRIQQQSLYKREGLNVGVGCLIMIVNLALTMVVFFTFYSSLRKVSAYQAINEYEQVYSVYEPALYNHLIESSELEEVTDEESAKNWWITFETRVKDLDEEARKNDPDYEIAQRATDAGLGVAVEKYNEIKSSWLWVESIWRPDAPVTPFQSYSDLKNTASGAGYGDYVEQNLNETAYNAIANAINGSADSLNGYYILAISAGVLTFLSQWISELHTKLKNKKAKLLADKSGTANGKSMKIMKFVMPIIMLIFVISSTATFGIYMLASNLTSLLFGEITTIIVDAMTKKKRLEVEEELEKEANRLIKKGKLQE